MAGGGGGGVGRAERAAEPSPVATSESIEVRSSTHLLPRTCPPHQGTLFRLFPLKMARAPVINSDKGDGADDTPKEIMDAANLLVDEVIREAEATVSKNNKSSGDRRKFQFLTTIKNRAVRWFREHFGTRGRYRSDSGDPQAGVEVAK
ncbi:hypothetical protein GE061_013399 [Apolygus lucorum]|uniref:Uncharacterized protein n=1 Tax=Apolygus lucorum TaxID=248454 RepID=A0A6A4JPZ7_APOLU|nr:hypothetical protein GE061_013399 [Apolygus lucorum]